MPDISLGEVHNNYTGNTKFSEFKGKLVILDFWNTMCHSCMLHLEDERARLEPLLSGTPSTVFDPIFNRKKVDIYTGNVKFNSTVFIKSPVPTILTGTISGFAGKEKDFLPVEQTFSIPLEGGVNITQSPIRIASVNISKPLSACGFVNPSTRNSLWDIFLLGLLGGLIALLTPCVFPIIPLTVSFFTAVSIDKQQGVRNGFLYGLFIFLIYVMMSVPFHILGKVQPELFNNIATSPTLNIIFFLVFVGFSVSLFGFVEISLPSAMANTVDAKGGLGSMGGIFFMALTLVIISFSCTGPILGTLLVGSLSGGAWPLTAGLTGFGLALALPFGLFAVFPNGLKALPRSGKWLDTVKKVLAFVELALAFKFLSNSDLVMQWGIFKREIFFAVWIMIGIALTLYLFDFYRLPHDNKLNQLGLGRKFFGVLIMLFVVYLIPGLTNTSYANVKLLSGFPPPLSYSIYGKTAGSKKGIVPDVVNDYDKALRMAKTQHRLLLVDFTGWACVNCRKMEEQVWVKPEVADLIRSHFVLVSLYVDDKQKLPLGLRIYDYKTKSGASKDIVTVGDKWATFQSENTGQVTQPLYMVLNDSQELMNSPVGYTPDADAYRNWLNCAYDKFLNK